MNIQTCQLLADYNHWQNNSIYQACSELSQEQLNEDRGAFFGSILATLNHILVGDLLWLGRFEQHTAGFQSLKDLSNFKIPKKLDDLLYDDLDSLYKARVTLDQIILNFCSEITEQDLSKDLTYRNSTGKIFSKNFGLLILHLLNHQTHHRGQITTLLNQVGIDYGDTDLVYRI